MFFTSLSIDPEPKSAPALKPAQQFPAAHAAIAAEIVVVDEGGGIVACDPSSLPHVRVLRPIFPLDAD